MESTLSKRVYLAIIVCLCSLYMQLWLYCANVLSAQQDPLSGAWKWSSIIPTAELQYFPCWNSFECARLKVPLDWNNTSKDEFVAIAIVRLPAKVPITDPRYGGAIIMNPGGPGYSGVRSGLTQGPAAQLIFDAAYEDNSNYISESLIAKYFDIIAFDPRGLNNTTPFLTCHSSSSSEIEWALQGNDAVLGSPEVNTLHILARSEARGRGCSYSDAGSTGNKITAFMSTAIIARDVVEIAERHGQWRQLQASKESRDVRARLRWQEGEEKINFWGLSYGTILGTMLATMQPHRVNRFLLDGVNDPDDYFSGLWERNIVDADRAFRVLFQECADLGPKRCPLWAGPTGEHTETFLSSIIDRIKQQGPVAVPGNIIHGPQVITLSDIRNLLAAAVMVPRKYWLIAAMLIEPLSRGDGTLFASAKAQTRKSFQFQVDFQNSNGLDRIDPQNLATRRHIWAFGRPGAAVRCADTHFIRNSTQFIAYWEYLRSQSSWMSDFWATLLSDCHGWSAEGSWLFADEHTIASNVTAGPILFASSLLDPVTPRGNAQRMQQRFPGSGLLEVEGAAHTSMSLTSSCAGEAYRRYFQTGVVQQRELCSQDNVHGLQPLDLRSTRLSQALDQLMDGWA